MKEVLDQLQAGHMIKTTGGGFALGLSAEAFQAIAVDFHAVERFASEQALLAGYDNLFLDWPRCKFLAVLIAPKPPQKASKPD